MDNLDQHIANLQETIRYLKEIKSDKIFLKILKKYNKVKLLDTKELPKELPEELSEKLPNQLLNEELWKDIEMYGIKFNYQISSYGEVKNKADNYIMTQSLRDNYKSVALTYYDNNYNSNIKQFKIHRLVGIAFIPNNDPINNKILNHIDGNKNNNYYKNLEWTTIKGNNQHAINTGLTKITKRRVTQIDMFENVINIFDSIDAAKKATGTDDGCIVKVCKGKRNTAGGFKWKYTDVNPNEQDLNEEELEGFIQVKDFPNYLIDRAGRVYSKPYKKFLKTIKTYDNTQELQLANNGIRKMYLLHNLMADNFLDIIEGKKFVGHIDSNKSNNCLTNLIRVNHSELCMIAKKHKINQSINNSIDQSFTIQN
jgi:hypothetical protein